MKNPVETLAYNQPREWLLWTVATAGGWLLGSLANFVASIALSATGIGGALNADPSQLDQTTMLLLMGVSLIMLLIVGLAVGVLQWQVLKRHVPELNRWAWFTGAGFALGSFAMIYFMGAGVGIMQWLLLRRSLNKTGWWPVMNAVAWPVGYIFGGVLGVTIGQALNAALIGTLLGALFSGAIIGAITGAVLLWLLRENAALLDSLRQERLAIQTK